jgi:phosphatidylinositol glycan class B
LRPGRNTILAAGIITHLLAAFFSVGYHQCDELFQVYEFAGYKLGLNNAQELPWEFGARMRSGIQPLIVYGATKALAAISVHNPFTVAFVLRLLQSFLSLAAVLVFLRAIEKEMRLPQAKLWLLGASLLGWCLPYFHARFSAENFSATLFLLGLAMLLHELPAKNRARVFLAAGALFGIAFVCRFQMSFMIAGLFAWLLFIQRTKFPQLFFLLAGILVALSLGLLADKWLYGQWTLSWWNYLDLNLFQDKASQFGREPLYYYIGEALLQGIPPFSLVIVFAVVAFWVKFKTHVLTWITLPFILLHFFVAHKELRFLFPALNFLPFMILYYFQSLQGKENKLLSLLRSKGFVRFALIVNTAALLVFTFKPADDTSQQLKKIYGLTEGPNPVLLYEKRDPYNNAASLHYFRKPELKTTDLLVDSTGWNKNDNLYYLSEQFNGNETLVKQGVTFRKMYSNFPAWFVYLNFNGWLDRATVFSVYKKNT